MRSTPDSADIIVLTLQRNLLNCYVNGERFLSHQEALCNSILEICRIKVKPVANTVLRLLCSILPSEELLLSPVFRISVSMVPC